MLLKTTRFGTIEIDQIKDIITFNEGIFGFDNDKLWTIIKTDDNTCIDWLQSIEFEYIALPLLKSEILDIHYPQSSNEQSYLVLTIPQNITNMTANLKAPIFVNNETLTGIQKLQPNKELPVSYKMYVDLKRYIMNEV